MATVTIYFNYSVYSDVAEVTILRSTTLRNEKSFEDALNGNAGDYEVIVSNAASNMTAGTYSVPDSTAIDNQQYWYCVATKGSGSDGGYRVGTGSSPSTTDVTTDTTLGATSVASVLAGSGSSSGTVDTGGGGTGGGGGGGGGLEALVNTQTEADITFVDDNLNEISRSSFKNEGYTDAHIESIYNIYVDAWNWMSNVVSLPNNGRTILSYPYIRAGQGGTGGSAGSSVYQGGTSYTLDGTTNKTFGNYFPNVALIIINAAYFAEDSNYNYWLDVAKHEIAHALGFTRQLMFPAHSDYALDQDHGLMQSYTGNTIDTWATPDEVVGTQQFYYWTGANALREYDALFPTWDTSGGASNTVPWGDAVGVPMEDTFQNMNPHWKEGWVSVYNNTDYVTIGGVKHPVLNREALSTVAEAVGTRMPFSRITAGYLDDMGYQINYSGCDVYNSLYPTDG